jgi:hypothetical protein
MLKSDTRSQISFRAAPGAEALEPARQISVGRAEADVLSAIPSRKSASISNWKIHGAQKAALYAGETIQ